MSCNLRNGHILGLYCYIVRQVYRALYGKNHHYEDNLLTIHVLFVRRYLVLQSSTACFTALQNGGAHE